MTERLQNAFPISAPDGARVHPAWRNLASFAATYAPAFLLFMLPALVNGFPLTFDDSGTYLRLAIEHHTAPDRPVYYSLFLLPLHWQLTLWPIVAAQAAAAIAVLDIFLRHGLAPLPRPDLALLLMLAGLLTSLPFFASQIMPDLFTPLMVLSLVTLVFRGDGLTKLEWRFLLLIVFAAVLFHQTNWLIAIATLAAAWALRGLVLHHFAPLRPLLAPALTVMLGLVLLVLPNYLVHRAFAVTRGGSVFLLAKVMDDGPGLDYLARSCPAAGYTVCAQLPDIRRYQATATAEEKARNPLSDYILWGGPLARAGGWDAVIPYASRVSLAAIREEPGAFLAASLRGFLSQLSHVSTGDGLRHINERGLLADTLRRYFPPGVHAAFAHSLEQQNKLHVAALSRLHEIMVAASLVLLLVLLTMGAERVEIATILTILLAVLANAFVTGALSAVHDRYQSRIACLIVVAALALGYRRLARMRAR